MPIMNNFQLRNTSFNPLANEPIVYNVTSNAQYFKNGDLIKLTLISDQANYTVFANFSTIDDHFLPANEHVRDYQNGTYILNYTLNTNNTRPDGLYQIIINTTNIITGFSILNTTFLNLDNTNPNIYIRTPQNGTFLRTSNISVEGFMNATGSRISVATINDSRFEFLTSVIGKFAGDFIITNKSAINQGKINLRVILKDSVNLINSTVISFTLDNTNPNITINALQNLGKDVLIINLGIEGTFSPIQDFQFNISEFFIMVGGSPIGQITHSLILSNLGNPLTDGKYTLNITVEDSVNLSYSLFIPFVIDLTPPLFEAIIQNVSDPEYYQNVNISIINPKDAVSGLKSIIFYYSIDNKTSWNFIDITGTCWAIIPSFPYQTIVFYQIKLTDNSNNENDSAIFNYNVTDKVAPVLGAIHQVPLNPNQDTPVNISFTSVIDLGAGIANIYLNYSIDGGLNWILKDITNNKWGLIEKQPPDTNVLYQIIAFDKAGNKIESEMMNYIVYFEYNFKKLLIFIIIFGSVLALSSYSGKIIYLRRKQKKLWVEYLNEKQKFDTYTDLRVADLNLILNDIESIELNLNKLLKFQWISKEAHSNFDKSYKYRMLEEFIGITQFSNEIKTITTNWNIEKKKFNEKFHNLGQDLQIPKREMQFLGKIDESIIALGSLMSSLRKKYPYYVLNIQSNIKIEYPFEAFDLKLTKVINQFQLKYNEFEEQFDQLLISRKTKLIEDNLSDLNLIFRDIDEWLRNAEEWSKILPLPKYRGYNYLLKLKKEQYTSLKDVFSLKIEKFRAELTGSINFAQDFIRWNYNNSVNALKKFEKTIYEDFMRRISVGDIGSFGINDFMKEKFEIFNFSIAADKRKIDEFYESHKEFHVKNIYDDWNAFIGEIPSKLEEIKSKVNDFFEPISRLVSLIQGISINFYKTSMNQIKKYEKGAFNAIDTTDKVSPLNVLISTTVWRINQIDNTIKSWINLLPFELETPQLVILLRSWNELKEQVYEKLNTLSNAQKVYKCEIMHEILDPLNDEIWACSNCGAITCTEHLEKWYHRKEAPECFKCGKTNTFKLKYSNDYIK